jgi:Holliday junction resolvasome RuvABC endonuclease subunit
LSLTGTGIATIRDGVVGTETITSKGRRADSLDQRNRRLRDLMMDILDRCDNADLVVVEGPSVMSKGGSNWDRAGLWWLTVSRLWVRDVPVAVAAPTVVKKFAAGKGNADKAAVAVGMARLWPEVECDTDNAWDGLALASMGAQRLGMDVPSRAHHAGVLVSVAWPDFGVADCA